jgi:hypothetical protein
VQSTKAERSSTQSTGAVVLVLHGLLGEKRR